MDAQDSPNLTLKQRLWRNGRGKALACLRQGGTMQEAAEAAGIDRATLYNWRANDEEYCEAIEQARREGKRLRVFGAEDYIQRAATQQEITSPGVTAALKTLAALDRETWGERSTQVIEGRIDGTLRVDLSLLSDAELDVLERVNRTLHPDAG